MIGLIQRRPDQIVHRRIDDGEGLGLSALHIEDAGDEDAGIGGDQAPRLEQKLAAEIADSLPHELAVFGGKRRGRLVAAIGHAEAAAEIDEVDGEAVGPELVDELLEQRESVAEGSKVGDLAADMHMHAARIDAGKCRGKTIKRKRLAVGNAEFVLGLAGGDLVMGLRVDVGIDAERDACGEPERRCRLAQKYEARAPTRR